MPFLKLKKRFEFVKVSKQGRSLARPSFVFQFMNNPSNTDHRFGFTASKKVGGSVVRNRSKRRLRALVQDHMPRFKEAFPDPMDMVFIARYKTPQGDFERLRRDLDHALREICGA